MAAPEPKKTLSKRSSNRRAPASARELRPASRREWTDGQGRTIRVVEYR